MHIRVKTMNHFHLHRLIVTTAGAATPVVEIIIDDQDLLERVMAVEKPMAEAEGKPGLAGAYSYLPADEDHVRSLLPCPGGEKVMVLQCPCGEPGCWPLLVSINADASVVTWRAFTQPHRSLGAQAWIYSGLGPFQFERKAYEKEIQDFLRDLAPK